MKRMLKFLLLTMLALVLVLLVGKLSGRKPESQVACAPVVATNAAPIGVPVPSPATNGAPLGTNAVPHAVVAPPRKLPDGWEDFFALKPAQQLNRVTAVMENRTLPADLLAFFEKEIFNRQHWEDRTYKLPFLPWGGAGGKVA